MYALLFILHYTKFMDGKYEKQTLMTLSHATLFAVNETQGCQGYYQDVINISSSI